MNAIQFGISSTLTFLTAILVWKIILYPKLFSPLRHFPQPRGESFFHGQLWRILREPTGAPMKEWINSQPNDGIIRITTVCNQERLMLTSPEALKEVMVLKNYDWDKPKQMRIGLGRILGHGVLLASGEEHKRQRKNLQPAFAPRLIDDLYPIFWIKACQMVEAIGESISREQTTTQSATSNSAVINMTDWLRRVTLDIIGLAGMGYDFKALSEPENDLNTVYDQVFNKAHDENVMTFIETMENLVPVAWLGRLPIKQNREVYFGALTIRRLASMLIARKRQKPKVGTVKHTRDILTVAMESHQFTDQSLVDQVMTFLAAGHETVSTTMTWALVTLCQRPEIQERLRAEVQAGLPSAKLHSQCPAPRTIDGLTYLRAVCNEVLRFHTPVPLTRRVSVRETSILGHRIPKNTNILLVPAAVNFSKSLWGDDALEFNPERWVRSSQTISGGAVSNYANLTFMHGPRSCIGMSFAKAEFACLLAAVIGRFKMEFSEPNQNIDSLRGGVTLRLKHDLKIRMTLVDR